MRCPKICILIVAAYLVSFCSVFFPTNLDFPDAIVIVRVRTARSYHIKFNKTYKHKIGPEMDKQTCPSSFSFANSS